MISALVLPYTPAQVSENLTIYPLIPPEAEQGWKLELFELAQTIPLHYHKIQRQYLLMAEGKMEVLYGAEESTILQNGDLICIDPGVAHSLIPIGKTRFFAIDLPGFNYPEDVFEDALMESSPWTPVNQEFFPPLEEGFLGPKFEKGNYAAYELISGEATSEKWSVALLDIEDSPRHFHKIETELFIVVNGILDIEVEGVSQILAAGESIKIRPEQIHKLKSASQSRVRVLCFSFPSFNPTDMHCVE